MDEGFQGMMGSTDMALGGKQAAVFQAIKHRARAIVAVMGTGGGKSILFMLGAWVRGGAGLTMVVVPG
jgi:superfamily II DNA helicase RecQ